MKNFRGTLIGILIGVILTSVMALAKNSIETIQAEYSDIKIYIDGVLLTPKDANGNIVEPFIYNGTTYLPVRAVASAFGKNVKWDDATKSVYLGQLPTAQNVGTPTVSQKNALNKALSYLEFSAFSKNGLIKQLEYEQFSHDDAVYAVENCGANWYEQAAKKAESYLRYSSFSRDSLIDQLEYEGFTYDEAVYGVNKTGL